MVIILALVLSYGRMFKAEKKMGRDFDTSGYERFLQRFYGRDQVARNGGRGPSRGNRCEHIGGAKGGSEKRSIEEKFLIMIERENSSALRNKPSKLQEKYEKMGLREERKRIEESQMYQQRLFDSIFAEKDEEKSQDTNQDGRRKQAKMMKLDVICADGIITDASIEVLAERCQTVRDIACCQGFLESTSRSLSLSLTEYPVSSVNTYLQLLNRTVALKEVGVDHVAIIDCCYIAHYLQDGHLVREIADFLEENISLENSLVVCELADSLNLPNLFELSLRYMLESMGPTERSICWGDLTPELRRRIRDIEKAIRSSIHGQRKKLYFASLAEHLAIFGEHIETSRERLAAAKQRQQEIRHELAGSSLWRDLQQKIERQERRLRVLEIALGEHKKMFSARRHC